MHITKLRLVGFKSFVEPTELMIEPGLTGVVGPNGCGKSNLLEALRWVMGETSHKSMRAAAMDDVIFSGTTGRPSRNSAEVTIQIDNAARTAPAEYNQSDVIEITRRIEREMGSAYRINGRDVRARDVKVLFEDAATGARSPALVRQGQIGEIVNAKPDQRRRILEDAAGVAGLHTRRHEAELRLKAAEANLAKLADVIGGLASQIEGLKRQSRQARRYKEISTEIRKAEALALYLAWTDARAAVEREEADLSGALDQLARTVAEEATLVQAEIAAADAIPPLRMAEAGKGAAVQRLSIESAGLERDLQRARDALADLERRRGEIDADVSREVAHAAEAKDALTRLQGEHAGLIAADGSEAAEIEGLAAGIEALAAAAEQASARHRAARDFRVQEEARIEAARRRVADEARVVERLDRQKSDLSAAIAASLARAPDARALETTRASGLELANALTEIDAQGETRAADVKQALDALGPARTAAEDARLLAATVEAEIATLERLIEPARGQKSAKPLAPVLDEIEVADGFEIALGAALGEDLNAPLITEVPSPRERGEGEGEGQPRVEREGQSESRSPAAPVAAPAGRHWRAVPPISPDAILPRGAEPLGRYVKVPPALARRLAQIGVVAREDGATLQGLLAPGQRLVSREGDLWRWDGFTRPAGGLTEESRRLELRNRLAAQKARRAKVSAARDEAAAALKVADERHQSAAAAERAHKDARREAEARLARARHELTALESAAREVEARLATLREQDERLDHELAAARAREAELAAEHAPAAGAVDPGHENQLAAEAASARAAADAARLRLAELSAIRTQRDARRRQTEADLQRWEERRAAADTQAAALRTRLDALNAEIAATAARPGELEAQRSDLLSARESAEAAHRAALDTLVRAETVLKESQQALRASQARVTEAREAKARVEARLETARTRRQSDARRIQETLGHSPESCLEVAGHPAGEPLPAAEDVERRLSSLRADRERLGGVNLNADQDLEALSAQHAGLDAERADVESAIAKLRGAIGHLNREARQRLLTAFDQVNGHFGRLFQTLFGGGEARLELIESEDPLEGGLEIIAKPPGKKPATLSLLSGGEQSLTALSLIFAVFLTNPAPICVLDEVDAPLDDANTERFTTLLEKMASETDTRFLVITHHPLTMARMQRLFGVTMAERGVSQLVSVNLADAARLVEASVAA